MCLTILGYYALKGQSFMMVCVIFHTAIIINRKNWRITVKLHFEDLNIFFKKSGHVC